MDSSAVGIYTLGGLLYIPPLGGLVNHLVQLYILVYHLGTHTLTYTQSNAHIVTWSKLYHNYYHTASFESRTILHHCDFATVVPLV